VTVSKAVGIVVKTLSKMVSVRYGGGRLDFFPRFSIA
jgi:hypothetical protein